MAKKLTKIISENWNLFSKVLELELENKRENYLLMINELKPYIKLLDQTIKHPNYEIVIGKIKINNPEYMTLIKMGYLKHNFEKTSFSIPHKAREITKGLYNLNHPKNEEEKRKITRHIIKNEKFW